MLYSIFRTQWVIVKGMNTSCAHNFFHQSNSWRRFYWDLSLLSSWDWRVTHMMSHHLHTNTYNDIEVYGIEPFISFLPNPKKNFAQKFLVHLYIYVSAISTFPGWTHFVHSWSWWESRKSGVILYAASWICT